MAPVNLTRALIVDDHEVVRSGIFSVLSRHADIEVVAAVRSAEEAISIIERSDVDVVLMDHRLPGLVGATACREIVKRRPRISVIALTSTFDDSILHAFLAAGARGYLLKDVAGPDLVHAVRAVARGECVLAPQVVERVIELARRARAAQDGASLDPDELSILSLAAQGCTNREIARRVGVSEGTVKVHLRQMMRKLGTTQRSQAVAAGIRMGVI